MAAVAPLAAAAGWPLPRPVYVATTAAHLTEGHRYPTRLTPRHSCCCALQPGPPFARAESVGQTARFRPNLSQRPPAAAPLWRPSSLARAPSPRPARLARLPPAQQPQFEPPSSQLVPSPSEPCADSATASASAPPPAELLVVAATAVAAAAAAAAAATCQPDV
eukprot:653095-Prymnesium_polylepis.1